MFGSVVAGAFQITFRAKMHSNDIFSFFKNHFWHQHIKTIQTIQTILNFSKKKKFKFFGNAAAAAFPNMPIVFVLYCFFLNKTNDNHLLAFFFSHHLLYFLFCNREVVEELGWCFLFKILFFNMLLSKNISYILIDFL